MRPFPAIFCLLFLLSPFSRAQSNPCGPPGAVIPEYKAPTHEGVVHETYPNGALWKKLFYAHNTLHGKQIWYWPNGNESSVLTYNYGMLEGPYTEYYQNGKLKEEGSYYYNRQEGAFTDYDSNGVKSVTGQNYAGMRNGPYTRFNSNGSVAYVLLFNKGTLVQDGLTDIHSPDGKIKSTETYLHGKRTGNWKAFYESGRLREEGKKTARRPGTLTEYYENGNIRSIVHYTLIPEIILPEENNIIRQGQKIYLDQNEDPEKEEVYLADVLLRQTDLSPSSKGSWKLFFPPDSYKRSAFDTTGTAPSATGEFRNDRYYFTSITDRNGKKLLKRGNGNYFGPYSLVHDPAESIPPGGSAPYDADSYYLAGGFAADWFPLGGIGVRPRYESDRPTYIEAYFCMAKGKFVDGLKQGEWLEGNFFETKISNKTDDGALSPRPGKMNPDSRENYYAKGNYVDGLREGLWRLYNADVVFEGIYEHGKRSGKWTSHPRKLNEKRERSWSYYGSVVDRCLAEGNYSNGQPDGTWTVFAAHSDTVSEEQLYAHGIYIGQVRTCYPSGKTKMLGIRSGDTLISKFYSPFGDELDPHAYDKNSYAAMTNGRPEGVYYRWDYWGNITSFGHYRNGEQDGSWLELSGKDTISRSHYTNGLPDGEYERKEYGGITKGRYANGEKEGDWIQYSYDSKRISTYHQGKEQLLNYWEKEKQLIYNGDGTIVHIYDHYGGDPYDIKRREEHYHKGVPDYYREYYLNGILKSLKYVTLSGDSLAVYNSPFGGQCVSSGAGTITDYDAHNRITAIHFYENGKLQKTDHYYNGKFSSSEEFFQSKLGGSPVIRRKLTKLPNGNYLVELTLESLPLPGGFMKLVEKLPQGATAFPEQRASPTITQKGSDLLFIWSSNSDKALTLHYTLQLPKGRVLVPTYESLLYYLAGEHGATVVLDKKNVGW